MSGTLTQTDVSFTFKWEIPNFLDRPECNGDYIASPEFTVCDSKNTAGKFELQVYPNEEDEDTKDYVSLCLQNISDVEIFLCFVIRIVDRSGVEREFPQEDSHEKKLCYAPNQGFGYNQLVEVDLLKKEDNALLSKDGTLTIILDIHKPGPPNCPVTSLLKDLEDCFEDMKFSDKQIVCQGKKFDVHQFVLTARSPYFAAMFSGGFKEGKSKEIVIDNIQPDILEEMLYFIYCGKTKNLKDIAEDLLKAADHCQLDNLKEVCGFHLSEGLDEDNCLDYLVLADKYNEKYLKKSVLEFMVKKVRSLRKTERWADMKREHLSLICEVMEKVMDENDI